MWMGIVLQAIHMNLLDNLVKWKEALQQLIHSVLAVNIPMTKSISFIIIIDTIILDWDVGYIAIHWEKLVEKIYFCSFVIHR